jgi:hypothetical protein
MRYRQTVGVRAAWGAQARFLVSTETFMILAIHRWRESTSDAGREIAESIDLQPPEAIICWDGLEASDARPRPLKWVVALIVPVVFVALAAALSATVLH